MFGNHGWIELEQLLAALLSKQERDLTPESVYDQCPEGGVPQLFWQLLGLEGT